MSRVSTPIIRIRARGIARIVAWTSLFLSACSPTTGDGMSAGPSEIAIAAEPQRTGDPAAGYDTLVNKGYITCGIPGSVYEKLFGAAPADALLPGRTGKNAKLPYVLTAFTAKSGVALVSETCLVCHAGRINGELVVGLGTAERDFTADQSLQISLAGGLITDPAEKMEWRRFADRVEAIAPFSTPATIGVNPADSFTAALFARHDPTTLAWLAAPALPLPTDGVIPVDVPPWWRMKKKTSMFYNAAGRGDHARIMMTASTLCTDTVAEAEQIDSWFPDVNAYLQSIRPPVYPFGIDTGLAARGRTVFDRTCSHCHGTYAGQGGDGDTYPNLVISMEAIGTDPALASAGTHFFAAPFIKWFNSSFYGKTSRLEPQKGYIAPPLDGIWATAPFLHNGSVPTVAALLDSKKRPTYFTRSFDSSDYDQVGLGWNVQVIDHGQSGVGLTKDRVRIYDTTLAGYGNGGHVYGDALSDDERLSVIEYLKTL